MNAMQFPRQTLICLFLCLLCCGLCMAQGTMSTAAAPPPGTTATDVQQFVSWVRFVLYPLAVLFLIVAMATIARHPAMGIGALCGCVIFIIAAASADSIVGALYHGGTG